MALIDYINGATRKIYLSADSVGITFHPMELYYEMRTLRRTIEELRKYDVFMIAYGNIPKTATSKTERFVMMMDGTRIVPYDTSQVLTVTGTVITDDGFEGVYCFDRSSLSPTTVVDINYQPKQVEVIEVPVGVLTPEESTAILMTKYQNKAVYINTELAVNGDGSAMNPFNNVNDTVDFAEANSIYTIYVYADVTIPSNIKNFTVIGIGSPQIDFDGADISGSEFHNAQLHGNYTGSIKAFQCQLLDGFQLSGGFNGCALQGDLTILDGAGVIMVDCFSSIPGYNRPSISIGAGLLNIRSYSGGLDLLDANDVTTMATVEMSQGKVRTDASCTAGYISVRGTAYFVDEANGTTIDTLALINNYTLGNEVFAKDVP